MFNLLGRNVLQKRNLLIRFISSDSTNHNSFFTISDLVNNCGLSQQKAISISKKVHFGLSGQAPPMVPPLPPAIPELDIPSKKDQKLKVRNLKDFVHITMKRGNTFVSVRDARGNKKTGASAGCLEGFKFKGKSRRSRYAAEATTEHVGRSSINLGMKKSVVMKVKGSTYFRKKKRVILSWREGYNNKCKLSKGVGGPSKMKYISDVTQLPHNGCRLPRKRRV